MQSPGSTLQRQAVRDQLLDYNLANSGGAVINFEARTPVLGFNVPEAVVLGNTGRSAYNSLQLGLLKRMSHGVQFNLAYTYSRSKDTSSADPGSTAGGGKPDQPNTGFVVQNDQRNLDANYALSDFDRPHRFSGSCVWDLPGTGALDGFRFSGFVQMQSGLPFSIYSVEPEFSNASLIIAKLFALGGNRNLDVRWDVFNVFNTVNYALPQNVIGSAATDFGKITDSVGGPRVMQLGARFKF